MRSGVCKARQHPAIPCMSLLHICTCDHDDCAMHAALCMALIFLFKWVAEKDERPCLEEAEYHGKVFFAKQVGASLGGGLHGASDSAPSVLHGSSCASPHHSLATCKCTLCS